MTRSRALLIALVLSLFSVYLLLSDSGTEKASARRAVPATAQSTATGREKKHQQVVKLVEKKNQEIREERKRFEREGWSFVETAPPDHDVIELNPNALSEKERYFQVQLQTTTFWGEELAKVKQIVLKARSPKTRFVAIESLGRSEEPAAQAHLIDLYRLVSKIEEKQQILGLLRPKSLDDFVGSFLFSEIENVSQHQLLREQASVLVVSVALMQTGSEDVPDSIKARVPEDWHEKFDDIWKNLRRK